MSSRPWRPKAWRWLSVVPLLLVAAACSDSLDAGNESSPGDRQPGAIVNVGLADFTIDMPASIDEGVVTFSVTNEGQTEHGFKIVGAGLEEELDRALQPGETRELSVSLKFGTYEVWCPVGDHRDRGMVATLQVLPAAADSPRVYPSR